MATFALYATLVIRSLLILITNALPGAGAVTVTSFAARPAAVRAALIAVCTSAASWPIDVLSFVADALTVTLAKNGVATEELAADYGSDGIEIGFNAKYLLDILGEIDGETVEVHLADAAAPTLLRESDKSNALYVLMPMRV